MEYGNSSNGIAVITFNTWKMRLSKIANYSSAIVVSLFLIMGMEVALWYYWNLPVETSQILLFCALISFFALVRAILALNVDIALGSRMKWKMLLSFTGWSVISFICGAYASVSAVHVVNTTVFPVISMLAYIWKSYLLLFVTCVNFVSAILLFHKLAMAIQIDTVEWFKRGFGSDGDPPKISITPIARNIMIGLIAQFVLNVVMFAFGSPEAFFQAMTLYAKELLHLFGFTITI
ncbi:MAG TPA: hypothetical protein VKM55_12740 [Candidatus Lokiarchaeia archaeon]|nr:hypothetical protein [Candidatus Lokiarchaeia archaeon]